MEFLIILILLFISVSFWAYFGEIETFKWWGTFMLISVCLLLGLVYTYINWSTYNHDKIEYKLISDGVSFIKDAQDMEIYNIPMVKKVIEVENGKDYEYWEILKEHLTK